LSRSQRTKWRIFDFINLGLNSKGPTLSELIWILFQLKLFALMSEIAWLSNAYVALMFAINSILLGAMLIAMRVHQFLNNVKLLVWLSKM
jgi:hypothetical protein